MYLTRFRVNTARRQARELLGSPHRMHAAVNMSFPALLPRDGTDPRVLWRIDRNSAAEVLLFVVSPQRPDLTHLVEQAGWPHARVLALRAPGTEPVRLDVHDRDTSEPDARTGGQGNAGNARHWEV